MKIIKMKNLTLVVMLVLFSISAYAQELGYGVFGSDGKSINQEKLSEANTLKDINSGYPSSWITDENFISSEIILVNGDSVLKSKSSTNNLLSETQKEILSSARIGSDLAIEVKYKTKNAVTDEFDPQTMNFEYTVTPKIEAEFSGGYDNLIEYFRQNAINKISKTNSDQFQLAKVKFTVDENGKAIDALISTSSEDEQVDQLLLEAISNMPNWIPAEDVNGMKVKQSFEFSVGNEIGC